jgi:predicted ATPase
MYMSRLAAFSRTALCRPLRSGTKMEKMKFLQEITYARKFSAHAPQIAARHQQNEHSANANVQLEHGLRFHECSNHRSAVLELDLDELYEAVGEFLKRRTLAGLSGDEEALHAMSDQLAERASVLYFNELDTERIKDCPVLLSVFKRLGERNVMVVCPPPFVPERRTVGSALQK